jgi:hypothetical protein
VKWSVRRALVLAVLGISGLLVSQVPASLHGAGMLAVIALVGLDVALIRATGGLAFARARSLDERQSALRDLAYRRGFRLLGLALIVGVLLVAVSWIVSATRDHAAMSQVDAGIGGRLLVAALELLLMMPTLVIAWMQRDQDEDEPDDVAGWGWLPASALAVAVTVLASLAPVAWGAPESAPQSRNFSVVAEMPGSTCRHFAGGRTVGAPLGATIGMRAEVCWNGQDAFVHPDFTLTRCGADNADDFAQVSDTICTASTDADGTLRYAVRARISPLPLGIASRDLTMRLVVTRDGRVLEQP